MSPMEKQGKKYGYPDCCISQFIVEYYLAHNGSSDITPANRSFGNTGFIPCTKCKIKMMKQGLKSIVSDNVYKRLMKQEESYLKRQDKVLKNRVDSLVKNLEK